MAGAVLTVNPTADRVSGKTYAIRIDPTAIDDTAGNSFAGIADDTTWTLTTSPPDTTAPIITNLSPSDGVTNAPKNGSLVVTFSEPIGVGTGNITMENLTDATQFTIAITDAQVTVLGSILTINPTADLTAGKAYAIQIAATAIDDLAGNRFAGIANDTTWNFTAVTPDTTAPSTTSRSPADGATGVANGANLVLTLNEAIKAGPGYITLKNLTDTTQSIIPATDTTQVTAAGPVLTINPIANLALGKNYAIRIDATAIDDVAGNGFAGITNDTTWYFTTNFAPVATAQSVSTAEDTAKAITLTGTDVEGSALTYTIVTPPASGTLSGAAPNLIYTPAADYSGPASFTFRVNDGTANSAIATVSITVIAPDPATFAGWQTQTWPGINDAAIIGPAADPDRDGLSNLLEWALRLDAKIPTPFQPALTRNASEIQYTYTGRKTAPGAAAFQLEWSDTLANDWSSVGAIQETPVSLPPAKNPSP